MKNVLSLVFTFMLVVTNIFAQKTDEGIIINSKGYGVVKIKTSAVCEMCKETIEKAMAYEKGVKASTLDVESKMLTVTFDTKKTTIAAIRKAVTLAGYDADTLMADAKAYDNLHACCKKDVKH